MKFILILISLLALSAQGAERWERVESTRWVPIPPTAAKRLIVRDAGGDAIHGRWSLCAPGDTLDFQVRGRGELRVESRPLFASDAKRRRFRLGVFTAPTVERKLARRSGLEFQGTVDGNPTKVGALDRWAADLDPSSDRIRVTLREEHSAPVLVRVLARGEIQRPARRSAERSPIAFSASAGAIGIDSNPYRAPSDVGGEQAELYWPVEAAITLRNPRDQRFELRADYDFAGSFHSDPILDELRHRVRLREGVDEVAGGSLGSLRFRAEQWLRTKNQTFIGRGDFEEYETGSSLDPNVLIRLGDRFDWREYGASGEARLRSDSRWTIELEGFWLRKDFVEDYEQDPGIYSLDQDRMGGELRLQHELDAMEIEFDFGLELWDYDEKFSRNANGVEQPALTTRLRRMPMTLGLTRRLEGNVELNGSLGLLRTTDLRQGYWDRSQWSVDGGIDWSPAPGWELEFAIGYDRTDYDNARVGNTTTGALREKNRFDTGLEAVRHLDRHWACYAAVHYENLENNSRIFAYSRGTAELGLRGDW